VDRQSLGEFGPFFAVDSHPAGTPPAAPWHPIRRLIDGSGALADRIGAVRAALAAGAGRPTGSVEPRVAASVAHLGLVARLLSPVVALAVRQHRLLDLDPDDTWWQPTLGGPFPLSVPDNNAAALPVAGLAAAVAGRVLDGPIRELTGATAALSVSTRILWGNVASALNGTVTAMPPQWTPRGRRLVAGLLGLPPLRGTASTAPGGGFRRRSCCLIYRVGSGLCGDCVLRGTVS
jgi:hypothetical protein